MKREPKKTIQERILELSRNKDVQIILFLILLGCITYRGWFRPGIIGRGDWIAKSNEFMLEELSMPAAWKTSEFGGYTTLYIGKLARYPVLFTQSIIVYLTSFDFGVTERLLWFFPFIVLSICSMYFLAKKLFKEKVTAAVASFAYLVNNVILFRMHAGHLGIGMAYALAPLVVLFFIKSIEKNSIRDAVLCGTVFSVSIYYEVRISFLTGCFLASYLLFQSLSKKTRISIRMLSIAALVTVPLQIFWMLPSVLTGSGFSMPSSYLNPVYLNLFSRTTLLQTLTLSIGYRPDQIFWPSTFILAYIVFSSIFLRKEPVVKYLLIMDVLLAFLAKGSMDPFGEINMWIFQSIPFFGAFRLPIKFMFLQAIPHTLLLGASTSAIARNKNGTYSSFIPICVITLILLSVWPAVFSTGENIIVPGKEPGTVGPLEKSPRGSTFNPFIPEDYFELNRIINNQEPDFRTLWLYTDPTFSAYNEKHPAFYPDFFSPSSYNFGYYFLKNIMPEKRSGELGKILGLINTGYVALLPKDDLQWSWQFREGYDYFVDVIEAQKSFQRLASSENVHIYENKDKVSRVYFPTKAMLIVGGMNTLLPLSTIDFSMEGWTLLFVDQLKENSLAYWDCIDLVVFNGKNVEDLTLATLEPEYRIDLWDYGKMPTKGDTPNVWNEEEKDWLKTFAQYWVVRKGELFESSGGLLETRAENASIAFDYEAKEQSEYEVWIRLGVGHGKWTLGHSNIQIQIDNVSFNVSSYSPTEAGLYWKKAGEIFLVQGPHNVNITNINGPSAIDELVIVPKEKQKQHSEKVSELLKNKKKAVIYEAETRVSGFEKHWVLSEKRSLETIEGFSLANKNEPTMMIAFEKAGDVSYLEKTILRPNEWNYVEKNISMINPTEIRIFLYEVNAGESLQHYLSDVRIYGEKNTSLINPSEKIKEWRTDNAPSVKAPELSNHTITGDYSMKINIISDGEESYGEILRNITPANYSKISLWIYPEYARASKEKTGSRIIDDFESDTLVWSTDKAPSIGQPGISEKSIEGKQSMKINIISDGEESYGEILRNITPANYSKISLWIYPEYKGSNKTKIQCSVKKENTTTYLGTKTLISNQWNHVLVENPLINETENASFTIYLYEVAAGENLTFHIDNLRFEKDIPQLSPTNIDVSAPEGAYKMAFRVAGNGTIGNILVSIDGFSEDLIPNKEISDTFDWKESKQFFLKNTSKQITAMMSSQGPFYFDSVILYSAEPNEGLSDFFLGEKNDLRFERKSSTEYELNGEIKKPSFVVFSESFDTNWELKDGNTVIKPVIATSAVNAFLVNKTGNVSLTLKYSPQDFVDLGTQLWIISLGAIAVFLFKRPEKGQKK